MTNPYQDPCAFVAVSMILDSVERNLLDNPEITANGRWLMMARRAQESLHALVQAMEAPQKTDEERPIRGHWPQSQA